MSGRYLIRIEAWPYSLDGLTRAEAQLFAGPRVQTFIVSADDIRAAFAKAELFRDGMLTNPHVWNAPITEVRVAHHGEEARFDRPCVTSVPKARRLSPAPVNPHVKEA